MKKFLIVSCLLSGAAWAAPQPDLYVRGAFNGWGIDNPLVFKGKGVYEARILISPGYHGFKLGSKDWSAEWVIDPASSVSVAPGADYKLDAHAGPEDFLFVKQTGAYRFIVDMSAAPVLRVVRIADAPVAAADPHSDHRGAMTMAFPTFDGKQETARFSAKDAAAPLREYAQSTTMQLRDPGPQFVRYQEPVDLPTVRSGNLAFDALFALAGAEMKQDSVREIKDGNYNGGAAIPCDCFETGEKWHYVWTRDLSYAADLGLAMLDPVRVMHSLDFKLSGFRGAADGLQIIQDTGSGGSWPVSTDRVTWAFGAEEALNMLPDAERKSFAPRALKALTNTIESDRIAAFDANDGLYTGEQSFLDWREQSYAAWITNDIASMATSKALSTNAAHYKALTLAAMLAREQGEPKLAKKYESWALDLKRAINQRLWLEDEGMFSSLSAAHFDGAPMHKFDWLGQSLAIVTGIVSGDRARSILARYPHGPMGAPVIYPQQQGVPVYHNRAIWPFVTAYGLKAAAKMGNVSVADAAYQSLMRGAALNLSNMENLEWMSGQPLLLDEKNPALIGPVINSRRQLWSVGAYLGMVIENVFGLTAGARGIDIKPFITGRLRRETFGASDSIALNGLRLRGKTLAVTVKLPASSQDEGFYLIDEVRVNGVKAPQHISWDSLASNSAIEIRLGKLAPGQQAISRVNADPYAESSAVFGPREPEIANFERAAGGNVRFDIKGGSPGAVYNVYRDGKVVAANLPAGAWSDRSATACYAVEAVYPDSGNRSHHSAPACAGVSIEVAVSLKDWGHPADIFTSPQINVPEGGMYQAQIRYRNTANQINLGISGGVKWLTVKDAAGRVLARHVIQLPHTKATNPPAWSTPLAVRLAPGKVQLELADFYNMSYLQSNSSFSAAGGADGASNRFDIEGVRLLKVK